MTRGYAGAHALDREWHAWSERLRGHANAVGSAALALLILGGVSVAPLAALVALVALLLPGNDGVRALAGPLIVGAAIWLTLAILCAHALQMEEGPHGRER